MNLSMMSPKRLLFLSLVPALCVPVGVVLSVHSESLLPILSVLAGTAMLVFLAEHLVFYAVLVCLPFSFRYILPSQVEVQTPTEPLLGMLVAIYCFKKMVNRAIEGESKRTSAIGFPLAMPMIAYILATFLSTINTPDLFVTLKGAFRASAYVMSGFLAYELIRNREDLRRLFISIFPSALVAVVWTICILVYHLDRWQWRSAYEGTPFTNYSTYGSFAGVFFLVVLSRLVFDRGNYDRVFWTILLSAFGVGLLLCFSRGVWFSIIVALGFLLLHIKAGEQHKKIIFIASAGFLILLMFSLPGVSNLVLERISSAFSLQFASNQARLLRWGQAFLMFSENPIIGKGYGAFGMLYEEDVALVGEYTAQFQLGAHSEYLQVLAELGIVGFACWIWLIIAFFRYGFGALKDIKDDFYRSLIIGFLTAQLSLLVHFVVNNLLNGDAIAIPFWLMYGLLPAVVGIAKNEDVSRPNKE